MSEFPVVSTHQFRFNHKGMTTLVRLAGAPQVNLRIRFAISPKPPADVVIQLHKSGTSTAVGAPITLRVDPNSTQPSLHQVTWANLPPGVYWVEMQPSPSLASGQFKTGTYQLSSDAPATDTELSAPGLDDTSEFEPEPEFSPDLALDPPTGDADGLDVIDIEVPAEDIPVDDGDSGQG